ncbi:DUF3800 domain-containing protein [Ralstonia pseudosolanacearum]|uniref:DUF3800 domain-containing protein n=1 Tax=Ralstonia pseudosolanacearum TaxID=1310165 RepID=UPI001FF8B2B0|nr:DUF3800 domain-containing protein [Ralstonia pseudosolanacearum]
MKTYVNQYPLTMEEVLSAGTSCVVIDETGNPGQSTGSKYLHPQRKSWAAVIFSPEQFAIAAKELPPAIEHLKEICGGDEFHLTDIYRGHKSFKGVSIEKRLGAIAFLAHIFSEYQFPVIFQTLDPIGAKAFSKSNFQQKLGPVDLRKHDELALWMLLIRIQDYICDQSNQVPAPVHVVIDESEKWKDSRSIDVRETVSNPKVFAGQLIYSRSSKEFPLIQLADFVAFVINRQQWLMTLPREKITDFDLAFLRIVSGANLNTVNIRRVTINLDLWQPEDYDFMRSADDEQKGIPPRS